MSSINLFWYDSYHVLRVAMKIALLCTLSNCAQVNAQNAYIGMDVFYNNVTLQQNYGKEIFHVGTRTQYNIFLGYYFTRAVGFEFGVEWGPNGKGSVFVPADYAQFGVTNFTALASNSYNTHQKLLGASLSYVPQILLYKNFFLIPVLGVTFLRAENAMQLREFDGAPATSAEQANYALYFAASKVLPRVGLRLQYFFNTALALRLSYIWEQTSLLQRTATRNINPTQVLCAKYTNSSTAGAGISYRL